MIATISNINGIFKYIAIITIAPPSKSEPVSPINIFAGCKLNIKNPRHAPQSVSPIKAISYTPLFIAIIDNAAIIIIETLLANPSIPSVKFTAFVAASITNIINGRYIKSGNFISILSPGIIVSVPIPIFIIYNANITDIAKSP